MMYKFFVENNLPFHTGPASELKSATKKPPPLLASLGSTNKESRNPTRVNWSFELIAIMNWEMQ